MGEMDKVFAEFAASIFASGSMYLCVPLKLLLITKDTHKY